MDNFEKICDYPLFVMEKNPLFLKKIKMRLKNLIFRIFCELRAEMRLGSLILQGVQRGTLEMNSPRHWALTLVVCAFAFARNE